MRLSTRGRRSILSSLVVLILVVVYLIGVVVRQNRGIGVTIRNESGLTLRRVSVMVESRGRKYFVGDLPPGGDVRLFVTPITESHINVYYDVGESGKKSETVLGYAEAGYCGNTEAIFHNEGAWAIESNIDVVTCWKGWFDL